MKCGHHKLIAAILDTGYLFYLTIQKLECLERGLRIVAIVKKLQHDSCNIWMDIALVKWMDLASFWRNAWPMCFAFRTNRSNDESGSVIQQISLDAHET